MDWINVKDALPETGKQVLTFSTIKVMTICTRKSPYWNDKSWLITHWQELPKPPSKQ